MLTVLVLLLVAAFLLTLASAMNPPKCPIWVPVLLLCIVGLLAHLPLGK
jgi:hypothetical protein